jgi:hypothetical protein
LGKEDGGDKKAKWLLPSGPRACGPDVGLFSWFEVPNLDVTWWHSGGLLGFDCSSYPQIYPYFGGAQWDLGKPRWTIDPDNFLTKK